MAEVFKKFESENAFLLSKFDEISAKIEHLKALKESATNQIIGLNFEKEELNREIFNLKKKNSLLRNEIVVLKNKLEKHDTLMSEDFNIRNKIVRIVSEIEMSEDKKENWNEIIDVLISEIDNCIGLLSK